MSKTKTKIKKINDMTEEPETVEAMPFVPPEIRELAERYTVRLPASDPRLKDKPWELRLHIAKILESRLGDEIQLTSMRLRRPRLISKSVAKLRRREPYARAYVTIKF